jgi:hypothetical protein
MAKLKPVAILAAKRASIPEVPIEPLLVSSCSAGKRQKTVNVTIATRF